MISALRMISQRHRHALSVPLAQWLPPFPKRGIKNTAQQTECGRICQFSEFVDARAAYPAKPDCGSAWALTPDRRRGLTPRVVRQAVLVFRHFSLPLGSRLDSERGQNSMPVHSPAQAWPGREHIRSTGRSRRVGAAWRAAVVPGAREAGRLRDDQGAQFRIRREDTVEADQVVIQRPSRTPTGTVPTP